jgi:hypothetical protein
MGMFDNVKCRYSLPIDTDLSKELFQTKSTPVQWMDLYEIREDGTLWHENYDTEDRSDPNETGFKRFVGCCTRINKRWEFMKDFIGEIQFYTIYNSGKYYIEFSSYFVNGILKELHLITNKELQE